MSVQGVVLAGGISSRMGFPKALMPFGNSFFLLEVYQKLTAAGASPVHLVINSGLRSSLEEQMERFPDGRLILNSESALGQIHSLKLGLEAADAAGASHAMVALVDQPFVRPETLKRLVAGAQANSDKLIVPQVDGERGHPIILPRPLWAPFRSAAVGITARDIVAQLADSTVVIEVDDLGTIRDVDSPADIEKFSAVSEALAGDDDLD